MSVELLVTRRWFTNRASEGTLDIDGLRECFTLEDRSRGLRADMPEVTLTARKIYGETAIPVGQYRLELYHSPKHGRDTLQLVAVPAFTNAQIHAANRAEELLGCIAPGKDRTAPDDDWIGQSRAALDGVRTKVVNRIKSREPGWIEIREVPELDERTNERTNDGGRTRHEARRGVSADGDRLGSRGDPRLRAGRRGRWLRPPARLRSRAGRQAGALR